MIRQQQSRRAGFVATAVIGLTLMTPAFAQAAPPAPVSSPPPPTVTAPSPPHGESG